MCSVRTTDARKPIERKDRICRETLLLCTQTLATTVKFNLIFLLLDMKGSPGYQPAASAYRPVVAVAPARKTTPVAPAYPAPAAPAYPAPAPAYAAAPAQYQQQVPAASYNQVRMHVVECISNKKAAATTATTVTTAAATYDNKNPPFFLPPIGLHVPARPLLQLQSAALLVRHDAGAARAQQRGRHQQG